MKNKKLTPEQNLEVFTFGKVAPQAPQLEKIVLGSILLEKHIIFEVCKVLKPNDFYIESHIIIYECILDMFNNNIPIDLVTVQSSLAKLGKLDEVGGGYALSLLLDSVSSVAHIDHHCFIVKQASIKRQMINFGADIARKSYDATVDALDIFGDANLFFDKIVSDIAQNKEVIFADVVDTVIEQMDFASKNGYLQGLSTFIEDVDRLTGGLNKGNLIIIGGKPGQGKTTLALQFALNQSVKRKIPIGFFSLEMTANELMKKILGNFFDIDTKAIHRGGLNGNQWQFLRENKETIKKSPFFISDSGAASLTQIKTIAKNWVQKHSIEAIYIDHLQLITLEGTNIKDKALSQRTHQIGFMCNQLKALAKELDLPIILLSQMSRASDGRSDKRPLLSDLRESGDIEASADVVMFPYREDYYNKKDETLKGFVELIFAKNRMGECGTSYLEFIPQFSKFIEWLKPLPIFEKETNFNDSRKIDIPF
jgi:replicative DNA helicase